MNKGELSLQEWFPTVIGLAVCPFYKDIKKDVVKYIKSFKKHHVYSNHYESKKIKKLNDWINSKVNEYAHRHAFKEVKPFEGWFNIYEQNTYQKYHTHFGSTISTNFFVESVLNDVSTVFKTPVSYQANGWGMNTQQADKSELFNHYTFQTCSYVPLEGALLIFRSHVEHGTELKTIKDSRITLNYNYK
tara:strand:- start:1115 stop:1681 length:567 start_codon:yes stop_codon:yes gene_type:complete